MGPADWGIAVGIALAITLLAMALDVLVNTRLLKGVRRSGPERAVIAAATFTFAISGLTRHTGLGDHVPALVFLTAWLVVFGGAMKLVRRTA